MEGSVSAGVGRSRLTWSDSVRRVKLFVASHFQLSTLLPQLLPVIREVPESTPRSSPALLALRDGTRRDRPRPLSHLVRPVGRELRAIGEDRRKPRTVRRGGSSALLSLTDATVPRQTMDRLPADVLDLVVETLAHDHAPWHKRPGGYRSQAMYSVYDYRWLCRELVRVCRVSSAWARAGQRQLMRRVSLPTDTVLRRIDPLFHFSTFTLPKWSRHVRFLHISFSESAILGADDKLAYIIENLPNLVSLWVDYRVNLAAAFPKATRQCSSS